MLKFVPQIGLLATASLDSRIKFFELGRLNRVRIEFRGHEKACNGFVYNERSKLMASCGVERDVLLWSPFSPDNISRLSGHNSSCKCVCSIHGTNEIVSLDVEGIVKVWNLRHQHCLQTLYPWGWFRSGAYHFHGKRLPNGSYNSIKKTSAMATIDRWYGRSIKRKPNSIVTCIVQ